MAAMAMRFDGEVTENAGFNAEVRRYLGLDFVTNRHKIITAETSTSLQLSVTRELMLTTLVSLWRNLAMARRYAPTTNLRF